MWLIDPQTAHAAKWSAKKLCALFILHLALSTAPDLEDRPLLELGLQFLEQLVLVLCGVVDAAAAGGERGRELHRPAQRATSSSANNFRNKQSRSRNSTVSAPRYKLWSARSRLHQDE